MCFQNWHQMLLLFLNAQTNRSLRCQRRIDYASQNIIGGTAMNRPCKNLQRRKCAGPGPRNVEEERVDHGIRAPRVQEGRPAEPHPQRIGQRACGDVVRKPNLVQGIANLLAPC